MNRYLSVAVAIAAISSIQLAPNIAEACGGLFCNGGPTQVNQAAERIIFAAHPDGTVTAAVQILYDGPADRFGWLLPVPGIPEVGLSSDAAFTLLQQQTNPQYQLQTRVEGECRQEEWDWGANNGGFDAAVGSVPDAGTTYADAGDSVTILARGTTGPYDYVVIQIDASMNKLQTALDWLDANNYQAPGDAPGLIGPYLDEGYNLLAVRLQKTSTTGSIRPLRLNFEGEHPMIPMKLTAIAANDDMGVLTWVLGPERAVPVNYKALELNDALINWFTGAQNYNDVVIAAANEASGQGFVTEYAAEASELDGVIWTWAFENAWNRLETVDWTGRERELFDLTIMGLSYFDQSTFANVPIDGMDQVIAEMLPNITADQRDRLYACAWCFVDDGLPPDFSWRAWVAAVEKHMVEPMKSTQELFDTSPWVTRMYTTLSADEMTVDPTFDFNPDLGAVSNIHIAERIIECNPMVYQWEAPFRVELPSGFVVRGSDQGRWPVEAGNMMPATLLVSEVGTQGEGMVVRDNRDVIASELDEINALTPPYRGIGTGGGVGGDGWPFPGAGAGSGSGEKEQRGVPAGSCSTVSGSAGSAIGFVALLLIAFRRRRRT